jgi:hypothetical protein
VANSETWKFEWSDDGSKGIDPDPGEPQPSIRFSNCWKPLVVFSPSRSDTTDSTTFSNHCRPRDGGDEANSGKPPPPEPTSGLVVTDPPLVTGGSVISVPPWPSEVALKFDVVWEPSKVRVVELAPSLIVSVPLALAPVVVCFQVRVLLPEL